MFTIASSLIKQYDLLPVRLQNLAVSLAGLRKSRERYGKEYWRERQRLIAHDRLSLDEKVRLEIFSLRDFVQFAVTSSAFYEHAYRDVDLDHFRTSPDLRALPVLHKEQLRKNIESIMTVPRRGSIEGHTGGTTGKSLVVRFTKQDNMHRMALLDHFKARHGFESRKMRRATFNGQHIVPPRQPAGPFCRYNAPVRQMIYSSFHLQDGNLKQYVDGLNSFKPEAIDGFFSSIVDVASFIERNGMTLRFQPIAIFPTSETVTATGRELIERVFAAPVYNQYASSEGAPFVTECVQRRLHIEMTSGIVESGGEGESALVTSFTTHGTPLIRYRIGDVISSLENETCDCRIESRMVSTIDGRSADFLYRSDGAKINGGNVANLFKNMPRSLISAQARQHSLQVVTLLLQYDPELYRPEDDVLVRHEFLHKFGPETTLVIRHVSEVPREASGKLRLIVNSVGTQ